MQSTSEPIICAVNIVSKPNHFERHSSFSGEIVVHKDNVLNLKSTLYDSINFKRIQLPYRFTIISFEVIYKDKHIESIHLAGVYLSGISIPSGTPQLTVWKTLEPPITSIDETGNIILSTYSKKTLGDTFFIAHWSGNKVNIHWSLKDNTEILSDPKKYPWREWVKLEF